MKIAIVSPTFPPKNCGVGDHASKLASELSRLGKEVRVWTGQESAKADSNLFSVVQEVGPWSFAELRKISEEMVKFNPNYIFIEYTPYLFDPKGGLLNLLLPLWIQQLRGKANAKIVLLAHEMNYPVNFSPVGIVRGLPQFSAFVGMAAGADFCIFTYEAALAKFQKLMPWKKKCFHWLPVGSNICFQEFEEEKSDELILLHFGGSHPTHLLDWTFAALQEVKKKMPQRKVSLILVGLEPSRLKGEANIDSVKALGYLSESEVSKWLHRADLVLAPFSDGISTRRGSAMAAFAHGKPVLSTRGRMTSDHILWEKFCFLVSANEKEEYARKAGDLLGDTNLLGEVGRCAKKIYQEQFDWPIIAQQILNLVSVHPIS